MKIRMTNVKCQMVVLLSLLAIVGCAPSSEKPPQIIKVARGTISAQLPTTGIVTPLNNLEIKPPVSGRIEQVLVVEGQKVKKGQVLAWMSSSERAALLDAALAKGPAEIKYWQDVYKPAPIVAPLDGFITKRIMMPGQYFSLSDSVLIMADKLIVQAQVDETDIGRIVVGQKASIVLDAYPDQTIAGQVQQIAYESQTINNVTVYVVNVVPRYVPPFFRSGMSATVNFKMSEKNNVLVLPLNAVSKKGGRTYAFITQNDKIRSLQIQTGLETNDSLEVVSGLAAGDEVVVPTPQIILDALQANGVRQPFNFLGGRRGR